MGYWRLPRLKVEGKQAAQHYGHNMGEFIKLKPHLAEAKCKDCQATVRVSEKDMHFMGGTAFDKKCPK